MLKKRQTSTIQACYDHPLKQKHGISKQAILQRFGISRQAHHQAWYKQCQRQGEEAMLLTLVQGIRHHHSCMGTRKLLHKLNPLLATRGIKMGRDRLFDLLRAHDLLVPVKRRQSKTTLSGLWRYPNLLPEVTLHQPHQVWVGDITYMTLESGFADRRSHLALNYQSPADVHFQCKFY